MSCRLAYSFRDCRAGDTVLGSGYPVCNALSRHPESDEVFDQRYTNVPRATASVQWIGCRSYLTKLATRRREGEREDDGRR